MKATPAIATYRSIRQQPIWRLLAADKAPVYIGLLQAHLMDADRTLAASILHERIGRDIERLRAQGEELPQTAQGYLSEWLSQGWVARRFPPGAQEEEYELTADGATAIRFVASLVKPRTSATESRLATVIQQLSRLAEETDTDPGSRVAALQVERARIETEIADVEKGRFKTLPEDRAVERVREIIGLAEDLAGDFRRVRNDFDRLNRGLRESLMDNEGSRGDILDALFTGVDLIGESEAGRTFAAFWRLLTDPEQSATFEAALSEVVERPFARRLDTTERRFLLRLTQSRKGFLFVGPSGSGKSSLLDAHGALLTPPRWLDFNVAARENERRGHDRNLVTYLRGAWAQQTGDGGEYTVQYLWKGTTWSAVSETYENRAGQTVALALVLWLRGNSNSPTDVRKQYLTFERAFELKELEFFAAADFDVRRLRNSFADAFVREQFNAYRERFSRLLGIENELALKLLHKTQSAKNLGDLNTFLRDFMLDEPRTFEVADRLVAEFAELSAAHQAVVTARLQIEMLLPARDNFAELQTRQRKKTQLEELLAVIERYREQRRTEMLRARVQELTVEAEGAEGEVTNVQAEHDRQFSLLRDLQDRRRGAGGERLEEWELQIRQIEGDKTARLKTRQRVADACGELEWPVPDSPYTCAQLTNQAKQRLETSHEQRQRREQEKDSLKAKHGLAVAAFAETRAEIEAMERQPSNIPARMLDLRRRVAEGLGVNEDRLPFAGELMEVREEAASWQSAIERVMRPFALSLLVDEKLYASVAAFVNSTHLGDRLVYFRTSLRSGTTSRPPAPNSLANKLRLATSPQAEWLQEELRARFDYQCVDSMASFRTAERAITREGQVKHRGARHEKDDRTHIDDRTHWVLGFDNRKKLELFKQRGRDQAEEFTRLDRRLEDLRTEDDVHERRMLACQTLANTDWQEIDVATVLTRIDTLQKRIKEEKAANPNLATLDDEIRRQEQRHKEALAALTDTTARRNGVLQNIKDLTHRLETLLVELIDLRLTPFQMNALAERYGRVKRQITLESLDRATLEVQQALNDDKVVEINAINELRGSIEDRFASFNRLWPAESGGLDAKLESAEDFLSKLKRLQTDNLPKYEERFRALLREQSDQNVTMLNARLEQERKSIEARIDIVNDSLRKTAFNVGTHLTIEMLDRALEDVKLFKQTLRQAVNFALADEPSNDERRFEVLRGLVTQLSSQETKDRNWRDLVLDVRQHVEFIGRELDTAGGEVEIYRSGAGKSGGQRQKLTSTCLAAALRYQLGGDDTGMPRYATVVMDEAFDKADAEFTTTAMKIFETFGFQMIVATPLKSVMTLEPFIGGASFVHIRDRRRSTVLPIEYDEEAERLILPSSTLGERSRALS